MTTICPFCNLDRTPIAETEHMLLIHSKYPVLEKGHFLIIPKRHVSSWYNLTIDEWNESRRLIIEANDYGLNTLGLTDSNGGFNDGKFAGQTIFHAHFHVILRKEGDVKNPRGGIRNIIPEKGNY